MRTTSGHVARWTAVAALLAWGCEPLYPEVEDKSDAATKTDVTVVTDTAAGTDATADTSLPDTGAVDAAGSDATFDAQDVADAADASDVYVPMPANATNIDVNDVNWSCTNPNWQPVACAPGTETSPPLLDGTHIDLPTAITYADSPPSSGPHRPVWAKWGSYVSLPEQRWLHNIEHGGIVFLYHPCAPESTIAALKIIAKLQPADQLGPFRWVLTPYPKLPAAVAVVAWGHLYTASCVQPDEINAFINAHYRKAPEDEATQGDYQELWLNDWP